MNSQKPFVPSAKKYKKIFICVCPMKALEFSEGGALPVTPENSMACAIGNIVELKEEKEEHPFHALKFTEAAMAVAYKEPFLGENVGVCVVGNIENNRYLAEALLGITNRTISDEELIALLYHQYQSHQRKYVFLTYLGGKFSLVLYDQKSDIAFAARDISGEHPLYQGIDPKTGGLVICNCELKEEHKLQEVTPGHFIFGKGRDRRLHPIGRPTSDAPMPANPRAGMRRSISQNNLPMTRNFNTMSPMASPMSSREVSPSPPVDRSGSSKGRWGGGGGGGGSFGGGRGGGMGMRQSSSWSNLKELANRKSPDTGSWTRDKKMNQESGGLTRTRPSSSWHNKSPKELNSWSADKDGASRGGVSPPDIPRMRPSSSWSNLADAGKPNPPSSFFTRGMPEKNDDGNRRRSKSHTGLVSGRDLEHSNTPSRKFRLTTTASPTGTADQTESWKKEADDLAKDRTWQMFSIADLDSEEPISPMAAVQPKGISLKDLMAQECF